MRMRDEAAHRQPDEVGTGRCQLLEQGDRVRHTQLDADAVTAIGGALPCPRWSHAMQR